MADGTPGPDQLPRRGGEREQGQGQVQHVGENVATVWSST